MHDHVPRELLLVSIRRFDVVVAIINDVEGSLNDHRHHSLGEDFAKIVNVDTIKRVRGSVRESNVAHHNCWYGG